MNSEGFYLLNVYALLVLLLLSFIFFTKDRLHKLEDNTYAVLLVSCVCTIVFGLLSGTAGFLPSQYVDIVMLIVSKFYLAGLALTISIFAFYTLCISKKNSKFFKFVYGHSRLLAFLNSLLIFLLPLEMTHENGVIMPLGASVYYTYSFFGSMYMFLIVLVLMDFKNIKNRKYMPIIMLVFEGFIVTTIQVLFPQFNYIINPTAVLTCLLMYFTIENPDVKMIGMLDEAKIAAEKANRAKSDFLSNMSHEIRTPLNAIVGFSDCILEETTLEDAQSDAKDIKLASENLLEIVNGILDISKIEADKMEIVETDYNPIETMENVAKLVKPRLGEKPIDLIVNFAPDIPYMLHGDGGKLRQVITNILTNAAKYTEKGSISFYISCVNDGNASNLVISVEDTGRGIKPEQIDKLFTKFQRLDEDKNTTLEGTGLGLAITKRFVEMMGGKIVVQSKYGEGTKFTVYIKQQIVMLTKTEEHLITDLDNLNRLNEVDLTKAKVLVVDDNKVNIKVALKLLSNYGINADSFDSGFDCIDKVKGGYKYDLILLDDMMPKITGGETLAELKKIPGYNTPTVALTANAISGMREQYISMGFTDYLSKPIEKNELYRVLTTYIKNDNSNSSAPVTNTDSTPVASNAPVVDKFDYKDCSGKKVLIVDDNKINIKICTRMIDDYKFDIDSCLSGPECLEKVKEVQYDLIFMDYMMPEMDGIETLKHLKEQGIDCPVVCLTADAVEGAREKFLGAGFDEYISKPIDRGLMDDIVNRFIK